MLNKHFCSKIFSLFIILFFISCSKDFSPILIDEQNEDLTDITISNGKYYLDINNDDTTDFVFEYSYIQSMDVPPSSRAKILSIFPINNLILYTINQGQIPLNEGDTISAKMDSNQIWQYFTGDIAYIKWNINNGWDEFWSGEWAGVLNKYFPFGLKLNNEVYYGWMEMSCDSSTGTLTIHDYAVNNKANEYILAGIKLLK